ncbi:hypothetical protein EGW08_010942 [Elysia chlorotica]|uniref:Death domain-containing protein n=1 Tax=Elysia chlorotica TaxID=188477 RepID=A0A3S1B6Z7_ELYCH|nr:hypothetical protein EGW08_010942 [Elysia chlorotica]
MAAAASSAYDDIEEINDAGESAKPEVRSVILSDQNTGRPTVYVNSAKVVTSGDIHINNFGPKKSKKSKPLKPLTTCTEALSREQVIHISGKLGTRWKQLGRLLGFEDGALEQLELDNLGNSDERNYEMLKRWIDREGGHANQAQLAKHLAKAFMGKLADYLAE